MLSIRRRFLSNGWYPDSKRELERMVRDWITGVLPGSSHAGVVPHAGWSFCGSIIAQVVNELSSDIDTIVILGGHNPPGGPFISYNYDEWITPTGSYSMDDMLVESLEQSTIEKFIEESEADNTVEVVMALALFLKPDAKWAAWRVPADSRAIDFGEKLAKAAKDTHRRLAVLGSTDLTHYGPRYGFVPQESLGNPVRWVSERDHRMLDALLDFDGEEALRRANFEKAACSSGGAVAAMSYAKILGAHKGRVLSYATSRDVWPDDSFVGYAGVVWE